MTEPKFRNLFAPDSYFAPNIVATQNVLVGEGFFIASQPETDQR